MSRSTSPPSTNDSTTSATSCPDWAMRATRSSARGTHSRRPRPLSAVPSPPQGDYDRDDHHQAAAKERPDALHMTRLGSDRSRYGIRKHAAVGIARQSPRAIAQQYFPRERGQDQFAPAHAQVAD